MIVTSFLKLRMKSHIHIPVNVTWKLACDIQMPFTVCLAVQLRVYFLSYLLLSYHFLSLGLQYQRWPHFYWCILNIYMYIWNGDFLIGHMFVSFDWLLCCIIGRLLLVGSLIEKWFAYIGLLLLYFYFWFVLLPVSQSDFMYLSPWPVFFSWFALVKQAYICLFVAWFCWFRILEQHLFAQ